MTIAELSESFWGMKVIDWRPGQPLPSPPGAVRLRVEWEMHEEGLTFSDLFAKLRDEPACAELRGLIVGDWGGTAEGTDCEAVIQDLVMARAELPKLQALFLAEVTAEECEISWIHLTDMSPLWMAFPDLEHFRVRGMEGLSLGRLALPRLTNLTIETGGMAPDVVDEVCRAELPSLEHLELWLGDVDYGWSSDISDLAPILNDRFPNLRYLGLRNSCIADDIARAIVESPVLRRIDRLDLSLGALSDEGVDALAACADISRLQHLDIHHHFASPDAVERLRATGVPLNADDAQETDEYDGEVYTYVAVSE